MTPTVLFFGDMFRHWVGIITGLTSLFLSVASLAYPEWFTGSKGFFHQKAVYWFAGAVCLLVASFAAWSEKHEQLRTTQRELEQAVNKDRPEVFAHFGISRLPKLDYSGMGLPECVQVSNLGKNDAWDVKIAPVTVAGLKVELFDVEFLRADHNASMLETVEGLPQKGPRTFRDVLLKRKCWLPHRPKPSSHLERFEWELL